jgi:hypothetical protein
MKKKLLMSLVLLAIIGTSAVFAQQPTLDKLKMTSLSSRKSYAATALNKDISGAVVIPATYEGLPVEIGDFTNCRNITSITIPDGLNFYNMYFYGCTGLTSATLGSGLIITGSNVFPGDLLAKYRAGGAGTYTRQAGSNTWTKQGGDFSLNGTWTRSDGMKITIADNGANIVITGDKPNNGGKLNDTYTKR